MCLRSILFFITCPTILACVLTLLFSYQEACDNIAYVLTPLFLYQEACDNLFRELLKQGLPCAVLHGGMGQVNLVAITQ